MFKVFPSVPGERRATPTRALISGGWTWVLTLAVLAACGSPSSSNGTTANVSHTQETPPATAPAAAIPAAKPVQESAEAGDGKAGAGGEELVLASAAAATPPPATAESKYQAGQDYKILTTAQGTTSPPDKIELAEVFWYGCPHCYNLDPKLQDFVKKLPSDVSFVRIPVMWSAVHEIHARLYYTAQALNKLPEMHEAIFREIHVNHNQLANDEQIQAFFAKFGVGTEEFQKAYHSFAVEGQLRRAKDLTLRYEIRSVPVLVVNGKYTTDAPGVKSQDEMLAIAGELIARERQKK